MTHLGFAKYENFMKPFHLIITIFLSHLFSFHPTIFSSTSTVTLSIPSSQDTFSCSKSSGIWGCWLHIAGTLADYSYTVTFEQGYSDLKNTDIALNLNGTYKVKRNTTTIATLQEEASGI